MKVQKLILTVLACGLFFSATAQRTYIKAGAGYNFAIGSAIYYQMATTTIKDNNGPVQFITRFERVDMNIGKGVLPNVAIGYQFGKHLGAELAVSYLVGGKTTLKDTNWESNIEIEQERSNQLTGDFYSRMVLVQPSVVFSAGMEGRLNPYTRFGLVLAAGPLHAETTFSNSNGHTDFYHEERKGGVGTGLQAALGTDINLRTHTALYAELTFNNLSYAPTKAELTAYTVNGTDQLETLNTSQKESEYTDSYTSISSNYPPGSQPMPRPKTRYPMSNVGLQAGLKFSF